MHALAILAVITSMIVLGAAPADAMALKAKKLGGSFVTAYEECTTPDTVTDTGIPACTAVRSDPVCGFGPGGGVGKFKLISKPNVRDVKLKAKLKDLDPACQGETLSFAISQRLTGAECAGSLCTLEDFATGRVAECVVDAKNRCKAAPIVSLFLPPPGPQPTGEVSLIEGVQVFRGNTLTFDTGVLLLIP